MKKMLVMCGAGHATSTIVHAKINQFLEENNLMNQVTITQGAVTEETANIRSGAYDIVVSTTIVPEDIKDRVINGVALLTGINTESVYQQIKEQIIS